MNRIRRYYWQIGDNKYSLKLSNITRYTVKYDFRKNGITLFSGNDFHPSPIYSPNGIKAAYALLGFLTLKSGDTDKEYFNNYTLDQIAFSESMDCEELQSLVYDYENKRG